MEAKRIDLKNFDVEHLKTITSKEGLENAKQYLEDNKKFFVAQFGSEPYDVRISYLNYRLVKL